MTIRRAPAKQVIIETDSPRRFTKSPMSVACAYCGAAAGEACQIVLVPGLQVSTEWAHRAREAAVTR